MDSPAPVRLRVIAADDPASNKLIGALRGDGLEVLATGVPASGTLARECRDPAWQVLLVIDHPALSVADILAAAEPDGERFAVLLAARTDPAGPTPIHAGVNDIVPARNVPGLLRAIRHQGALQRAHWRNHRLLRQLRDLERRQLQWLEASAQPTALVRAGVHLYCNPAYGKRLGVAVGEACAGTAVADLVSDQDRDALARLLDLADPDRDWADLCPRHGRAGECLRFTCHPSVYRDDDCLQVTVTQAPGNRDYARRKQQMARQDLLTRLDNLPFFLARLESAIAAAINAQDHSVLLVVQIERFREVRRSLGETATNAILGEIAAFLRGAISKPFTASRLADDEFGLLLFRSAPEEGADLARYIQDKVGGAVAAGGDNLARISVAVGLAALNERALDADAMLGRARMNRKTAAGDPGDTVAMTARLTTALAQRRLELVYQPVLALHEDDRERYEVLVRLRDDDGHLWLPESFLPHANINNLGEAVDRQVLTRLLARPALVGHNRRDLLIHLTSNTLANLTLLPWLNKRLGKAPQLTERLIIQINEIDLSNTAEQVAAFAACLDQLGIGICLNRFGVAVDPLAAVRTLKPVMVRLDDSLVRDIAYSREQQNAVAGLVRALHHQGVKVAVTRIEDMEWLPLLWALGVDFVQGHCIQAPGSTPDFVFPVEEEIGPAAVP